MSPQLISRSPDLKRLRDEGYDVVTRLGYLLLRDVPYVTARREIARGTLVSKLNIAGDVTGVCDDHVAYFSGETPCDERGDPLTKIVNASNPTTLIDGVIVQHTLSSKPSCGMYADYYEKMRAYVAMISSHAEAVDGTASAKTFPVVPNDDSESVFEYEDTASSRANIAVITQKLAVGRMAIIGLGGTGSYILDLVAKTPQEEIHLYDGDRFRQHNAFRCPGAARIEELRGAPYKAEYFRARYASMHKRIVAHPYYVDAENVQELRDFSFVFVCVDSDAARRLIVEKLDAFGIPFVDVGMGLWRNEDALGGVLRVTTSTQLQRSHIAQRVPLAEVDIDNEYSSNIQIADLNAMTAALAVIKWKKLAKFYVDDGNEHHVTYTIAPNLLLSEEKP